MVAIFAEVKRVLRNDGSLWLNLGGCYAHSGACSGGSVFENPTATAEISFRFASRWLDFASGYNLAQAKPNV
jgi:hypothetical protein